MATRHKIALADLVCPYTGATGNVDLGVHNLTATKLITFGGLSTQFLKGDGTLDSNTYLTSLAGALLANGTIGLSADWNAGAHNITASTFIGALTGTASGNALPGQTMYIGTTAQAINRASAAEILTGITGLTPSADFILTQNSVSVLTSVESGATVNTIYIKAGQVGIGRVPTQTFDVVGNINTTTLYQVGGNTALWLSSDGASAGVGTVPGAFSGNYTGTNSFFAGNLAGARMTSGTENFLMGSLSGWNMTDAAYCVGIGTSSLRNNVHGTQNVGVGWGALYNETGSANVAIGYSAGNALTTGSYNTCIGASAGYSATAGISLSLMLGRNANATASNVCVIGGTGSDALSVVVGGTAPNSVALVDLISTTKGFRVPQMTTTQRTAITAVEGLEVYDLTLHKLYCYDGTSWQPLW